jgi:hypothetical protein
MPEIARIHGHKERGRLQLPQWDIIEGLVSAYPEGTPFEVICTPLVGRRSTRQNRYYWGVVLRTLSAHIGETEKVIHAYLLESLAPPYIDHLDAEHPPSTATMTTAQFARYLLAIQEWAQHTLGITIPNPDDNYAI